MNGCDGEHEDDSDCPSPAWDSIHERMYCPTMLAWQLTMHSVLTQAYLAMSKDDVR